MPIISGLFEWAGIGVAVGVVVAAVLLPLVEIRPFPVVVNSFLERMTFKLFPLLLLGISSEARSMAGVILVTILGNTVLYGVIFGLLAGVFSLLRRGAA